MVRELAMHREGEMNAEESLAVGASDDEPVTRDSRMVLNIIDPSEDQRNSAFI